MACLLCGGKGWVKRGNKSLRCPGHSKPRQDPLLPLTPQRPSDVGSDSDRDSNGENTTLSTHSPRPSQPTPDNTHMRETTAPRARHSPLSRGFSLIELIIAVAIISILAAVAIPIFLNQRDKAQDSTIQQQVKTMADQLATMVQTPTNTWTGLGTASGNLTIDGISTPKSGVLPYANTTTRNWCASKQSPTTGQIFAASNTSTTSGVYAATQPCTSAASAPTSGTLSATIVSETGNLLTDNQATGTDALENVTGFSAYQETPLTTTAQACEGNRSVSFLTTGSTHRGIYANGTNTVIVAPGETITGLASGRSNTANRSAYVSLQFYNSNTYVSEYNSAVPLSATEWTPISLTTTVPNGADNVRLRLLTSNTSQAGEIYFWDCLSIHKGTGGAWAPPGQPIYSN